VAAWLLMVRPPTRPESASPPAKKQIVHAVTCSTFELIVQTRLFERRPSGDR
jgi:hypothetical protein